MPDLTERHRLIYSPHAALHEIETVSTLMHSIGRLVEADAKLETVTTAEELDALPYGSAILDVYGAVRVKGRAHSNFSGGWAMVGKDSCPMHLLVNGKPFTVLHIGGK